MTNFLNGFFKNQSGATAVEYGLIAGLIALALVAALTNVGAGLNGVFNKLSNAVK